MEPSLIAAHPRSSRCSEARDGAARARVLEAITQVVADKGYAATTVADVCRAARVSRGTFYEQFAGKEEAFLEAYRHGIDVLQAASARPCATRTATGSRACAPGCARTSRRSPTSRASLAPTCSRSTPPARRAQAARDEALRRFARRYRASFEAGARGRRGGQAPSDDALFVLASGVDQLVAARVREHGVDGLTRARGRADRHRSLIPGRRGDRSPRESKEGT